MVGKDSLLEKYACHVYGDKLSLTNNFVLLTVCEWQIEHTSIRHHRIVHGEIISGNNIKRMKEATARKLKNKFVPD